MVRFYFQITIVCVYFYLRITTPALAQEDAVTVFQQTGPSVVRLHNAASTGTGMVLTKEGLILTNAHVIGSPLAFRCTCEVLKAGTRQTVVFEKVKILKTHKELDLALVQIDPSEHQATLAPCRLSKQKAITGQRVYAIGNPATDSEVKLSKTITEGLLSGVDRVVDEDTYYQISAAINPGNSGGPLCDRTGTVIGIVTLKLSDVDNVGFAIPVYDIKMEDFQPYERKTIDAAKARKLLAEAKPLLDQVRVAHSNSIARGDEGELSLRFLILEAYGMQLLQEAAYYDPNGSEIFEQSGLVYFLAGEIQAANAFSLEAIRLNPWTGSRAYEILGKGLNKTGMKAEAKIILSEGAAKYPEIPAFWIMLGVLNFDQQDYKTAANYHFHAITVALMAKDTRTRKQAMDGLIQCGVKLPKGTLDRLPKAGKILEHVNKLHQDKGTDLQKKCTALTPAFARWMDENVNQNLKLTTRKVILLTE